MPRTYINETYDIAYPLFGDGKLPFPMSVLRHIAVCLRGQPSATPITLTHMTLSDTAVRTVLSRGQTTVGVFTLDPSSSSTATLDAAGTVSAIGSIAIGFIPEEAYGRYNGNWKLDPSCVTYVPDNVYGNVSSLVINGTEYEPQEYLKLSTADTSILTLKDRNFSGGFASSGGWYKENKDVMRNKYDMVTAVNGLAVPETYGSDGFGLVIEAATTDVVLDLASISDEGHNAIVLTVNGTSAFPNCYAGKDEAISV